MIPLTLKGNTQHLDMGSARDRPLYHLKKSSNLITSVLWIDTSLLQQLDYPSVCVTYPVCSADVTRAT